VHAARGARELIERQVSNMSRLVNDLVDVSRVETGKLGLEREPVDAFLVTLPSLAHGAQRPG